MKNLCICTTQGNSMSNDMVTIQFKNKMCSILVMPLKESKNTHAVQFLLYNLHLTCSYKQFCSMVVSLVVLLNILAYTYIHSRRHH